MSIFDKACAFVLKMEGGYVFDPRDSGGETMYGISKRAYPDLDIKSVDEKIATEIYKRDYWEKVKGDSLPPPVALMVFDFAVNAGVSRASRMLQTACSAKPDGIIGPKTIKAVQEFYGASGRVFINDLAADRVEYYKGLQNWDYYGNGWMNRLKEVHAVALKLHKEG